MGDLKTKNISALSNKFYAEEAHYLTVDQFLEPDLALKIKSEIEFLDESTLRVYKHFNANVRSSIGKDNLPENISNLIDYLQSDLFLEQLRLVTGDDQLVADKSLAQGGVVRYKNGDFVNLHTDNYTHPFDFKLKTALTLLVYFNTDWKSEYNGILEIRDKKNQNTLIEITPDHNKLLVFETKSGVIHGIPKLINCPDEESRKAIVLWYYTREENQVFHPTTYFYKKEDKFSKKVYVITGNIMLRLYYILRKLFGDWDPLFTKIMSFFFSKK
jgi:Rps23 Pro-64 3,4-dihydroxylase Tpa1-like proline 4-hydroxylase